MTWARIVDTVCYLALVAFGAALLVAWFLL